MVRQASFLVEVGSGGAAPVQRLLESVGYKVLGWTNVVLAGPDAAGARAPAAHESARLRDGGSADLVDETSAPYASLFTDWREGILTTDALGKVALCNRSAAQLFGWKEDEMPGRPIESLIPMWSQISAAEQAGIGLNLPTPNHRVYGQRKDGGKFLASVSISGGVGEVGPQIILMRDISESERLRDLALGAKKMQSLGLRAASAAHDLKNALTALRAQLFLASKHPHRVRGLKECGAIVDRCAQLTEGLLSFASPDTTSVECTDLSCAASEALRLAKVVLPKSISISTQFSKQTVWVMADANQLTHAVINLILNARDAMPDGGKLTLRTTRTAGGLQQLIVEDTGHGMSEATLRRAFDPFFTTKPPGRGTGLGLYALRSLVERASGSVDITSSAGQGCRVTMNLPSPAPWEAYGGAARPA